MRDPAGGEHVRIRVQLLHTGNVHAVSRRGILNFVRMKCHSLVSRISLVGCARFSCTLISRLVSLDSVYRTASLAQARGLIRESEDLLRSAAQRELRSRRTLTSQRVAILGNEIVGSIGHTAIGIGCRIMLEKTGQRPTHTYEVVASSIANAALLRLMAPASDWSRDPDSKSPYLRQRSERIMWVETWRGPEIIYEANAKAHLAYERANSGSLLELTPSVESLARQFLASRGVSDFDWFVSVHVREDRRNPKCYGRNADIRSYFETIDNIIGAGGAVIRIGPASTHQLPAHPRIVDLSGVRRPAEVDLFALGGSRLFIGTQSGPSSVAPLFGVPTLWTNAVGIGYQLTYQPKTLTVPKLIADFRTGRRLSISQAAEQGLLRYDGCLPGAQTNGSRFEWIDNEASVIRQSAIEMLEGGDGSISTQQRKIIETLKGHGNPYPCPTSHAFASKHG